MLLHVLNHRRWASGRDPEALIARRVVGEYRCRIRAVQLLVVAKKPNLSREEARQAKRRVWE